MSPNPFIGARVSPIPGPLKSDHAQPDEKFQNASGE
jgi:hypothetical protein